MFPVYMGGDFLAAARTVWEAFGTGDVFDRPPNRSFTGLYYQSRDFYVEYAATQVTEPYWSNAIYLVMDPKHWDHYASPALRTDHFLIPAFGSGYQLVSPDFPHLNARIAKTGYRGLKTLISPALAAQILSIGGQDWSLPDTLEVHDGLHHLHDIVVINEDRKIVAPILRENPILREFF